MSYYLQQEFDFVERTKKILEQYDKIDFSKNKNEKYEVTLLLNCFVGLLILPKEHWFVNLPTSLIEEKEWGISPSHIKIIEGDVKSVKEVARHFRNSVAHYRFEVFSNEKGKISSIKFEDFLDKNTKTFEAEIPIENIKLFLNKFSSWFLENMKKS